MMDQATIRKIDSASSRTVTFLSVIVFELVFFWGTVLHLDYINGSPYWQFDWRQLGYLRTTFCLALPLIPYVYALFKTESVKDAGEAREILVVLMASNFLFQVAGVASDPSSFEIVRSIVGSRRATSYFYDANNVKDLSNFLVNFHTLELRAHSSVHPPGPILFYYLVIQLLGVDAGAYIGGFTVGLMASMGVPVLYLFASLWTEDPKIRLLICAFYVLIPGLVLFFPQFDQVYPIFSMLMIYYWETSLRISRHHGIYLGLVLFIAIFFAYNLLAIGAFHIISSIVFLLSDRNSNGKFRIVVSASFLAISTTVFCNLVMFLVTGFNPIFSFLRAIDESARILRVLDRPYRFYLLYNFYEFFLGSGMIVVPLLLAFIKRTLGSLTTMKKCLILSYIGFASILIVDLTGLLRSETTRLWLFLQPLILVPVGFELVQLNKFQRWIVFLMLWVNVVIIKSNMWFIIP